jgi:6-phospho-3-hexuloisomerase
MNDDLLEVIQSEVGGVLAGFERAQLDSAVAELDAAPRVFVAGAGRSGFMASAFAMRLVHLGLRAHVVGEATAPATEAADVLVAVSGSGTTGSTVRAAEEASRAGGRVVAVTTDADSSLARLAHSVLAIPAATKHRRDEEATTIQPLSSLFDQCVHLVLDALCLDLANRRAIDNAAANRRHVNGE